MHTIIVENLNHKAVFNTTTGLHVMSNITCFSTPIADNINPLLDAVRDKLVNSFQVTASEIRISVKTEYISQIL